MKLQYLTYIIGCLVTSVSLSVPTVSSQQTDLLEAYFQAMKCDPTFKKANSDWESAKQNLPIARAAYLTQVALSGNAQRQYNNVSPSFLGSSGDPSLTPTLSNVPVTNGYNYDYGFLLNVTQPVFNLSAWNSIRSASASVKSATATYAAAGQDLMVRIAKAYIAVLQAYDQLRYQLAEKRAVQEQLEVAEAQFKVGLIAITGVYDARATFDQAVAQAIADQNSLNDAVEELAAITGVHYLRLRGIKNNVPLVIPQPNNINTWVNIAMVQNYSLMAQNYSVLAARNTLKQQSTSWLPQLNLAGQYLNDNQTTLHTQSGLSVPQTHTNNVLYGFTLDFPVIQGGLVTANTRQAKYNYLSASDQREFTYRSVVSDTRQSFLGVITGISKIQADAESIVSAQNELDATKVSYQEGTRTMVDVLNSVTSLYQARQQYADDQYNYLVDTVELKYNAGTLCVDDLRIINTWLKENITLDLPEAALKSLEKDLPPVKSLSSMKETKKPAVEKAIVTKKITPSEKMVMLKEKSPTLALPAPATEVVKQPEPKKEIVLNIPAPQQTQSVVSATPSQTPIAEKNISQKKVALDEDEKVIPLYEMASEKHLLPSPT